MHAALDKLGTHDVTNQPGPPPGDNRWTADPVLRQAVTIAGGNAAALADYASMLASSDMARAAQDAERHAPRLVGYDRGGRRLDEVVYHPAYHALLRTGIGAGYAAIPWEGAPGGHATHAAMVYLASQTEPGHCCPMTMTYAGIAALSGMGAPADAWQPMLKSRHYDPSIAPLTQKTGGMLGMAMTEKQGGSDVRASTTRAERDGEAWRLTGHKWFCSAPMSDGFLTLAQAPGGLTCFLVPRWLPDGRNGIRLMRLKDKLGNRSNASAEIEYDHALAWQIGEPGEGVRRIIAMVHHTRLDTAMAPVGLIRAALTEAHYWCAHRSVFQKRLIDQPLMRAVLADLALDWDGALALAMRVARAFDDPGQAAFARVAVALAKYLNNKRAPLVIAEAMEVLGGMGYVEDTPLPMLYREAPLNGIWEGAGNVICLDVLRTLARVPAAREALRAELEAARGIDRMFDAALDDHDAYWRDLPAEAEARYFAERLALLLSAAQLLQHAPGDVARAYVKTRLAGVAGRVPGSIPPGNVAPILARLGGGAQPA